MSLIGHIFGGSKGIALAQDLSRIGSNIRLPVPLDSLLFGDRRIMRIALADDAMLIRLCRFNSSKNPTRSAELHVGQKAPRLWRNLQKRIPVVLDVPADQILTKRVELPDGAARELKNTIEYNLSQWTPFHRDEVYAGGRLLGRKGDLNHVEIRLVPKPVVEQFATQIESSGLKLDALSLLPGSDDIIWLDDRKRRRRTIGMVVDLALLASALGLLSAIAITQYQERVGELNQLKANLRAEIARHTEADALSDDLARLRARRNFLDAKVSNRRDVREALNYILQTIPLSTELEELDWSPGELRIVLAALPQREEVADINPWPSALASTRFRSLGIRDDGWPLREWVVPESDWLAQ